MEDPAKPPMQREHSAPPPEYNSAPPGYPPMPHDPNAGMPPPQYHQGAPPPGQPYPPPQQYQQYNPPPHQPVAVGVPQPQPVYYQGARETYVGPLTLAVAILPGVLCCFWCSVLILACPIDERPAAVVVHQQHMAPPQQQMMYQQSPPPPQQPHY